MRRPFEGHYLVTQPFGMTPFFLERRQSYPAPGHAGIDFGLPEASPVLGPVTGRLEIRDHGQRGWGYHAVIEEPAPDGVRSHVLAHLARGSVTGRSGQLLREGDYVGLSGATGFATGPHLHYEIRDPASGPRELDFAVDPRTLLPETADRFRRESLIKYAIQAAARAGIDPDLFRRQIQQESGWNMYAYSPAGAIGLGQIVPKWHPGVNPWDPHESLDYAARLMRRHLNDFAGSWALALAAYNAGAGAVRRYGGVPPFSETRQYVAAILSLNLGEEDRLAGQQIPDSQRIDRFLHLKAQELAERAIGIVNRTMAGLLPTEDEARAVNEAYAALVNDWPSLWQAEKAVTKGAE